MWAKYNVFKGPSSANSTVETMGVKHSYFMLLEDFLLQRWEVILHISEAVILHFTPLHLLDSLTYLLLYRIPFYTQLF